MRCAPDRIRDNEHIKMQKFKDGLDPEVLHDVQGHDMTTLAALINMTKTMEDS